MAAKREETPPILVKVFYRTNAFHRLEEFSDPSHLPACIDLHTWRDCTLKELTELIADASPGVLPCPAIGTRLVFRLVYRETQDSQTHAMNQIGTFVIGEGGSAANSDAPANPDRLKTLAECRFIPGDLISCAILPPNDYTGEVQPASVAREGRGSGPGEADMTILSSRIPTGPRIVGPSRGRGGGLTHSRGGRRGDFAPYRVPGRR
ncbi:Sin3 associated polypeptide p18-domain-containing protein [Cladorrhinum samala]|uniref:Sin3 associated polypeptide p18-domain-containing protein n=1 Tax=Cladorrhinum samala TaxID=585594 RepID=A0AAV9HD60_9PEZI|nr:Sin3 associated polypeptide p18-domain-containing protein [Cladorrhinum samala]